MPQQTLTTQQALIETAKASIVAYNDKNWDAVRALLARDVVYEEYATKRRLKGVDQVLDVFQGWAKALPDSKATFRSALASGSCVVLEVTWRGTHRGPLQTPAGEIAATGKSIELPGCQVIEVVEGKVKAIRQYFDLATMLQQLGIGA